MSDEAEKVEELMRQHADFASGKTKTKVERPKIEIKDVIFVPVAGLIIILLAGLLISLVTPNDLRFSMYFSSFAFAVFGIAWIGLSYSAGAGNYMAEMTRRAWTNTPRKVNAMQDFKNMWNWGSVVYGFVISGSILVVLFFYEVI
ncbi:MAG: hypothetical protein ACXAE3_11635 [Candidatus Kariarchaeaceae archaeon]